jgi:hypothetical protein
MPVISTTDLPTDKEFRPQKNEAFPERQAALEEARKIDPNKASKQERIAHFEAKAQEMANENDCNVLCHWIELPHYQYRSGQIAAVLIPSDESVQYG